MAKLAQTSIRFKEFEIGPREFELLSKEVDAAAARIAQNIYGPNVEVDVVVEAGSLLIRVTVIGGLLWGVYDGISKYKDFRESIEFLVRDAEKYGSAIVDQVVRLTGAKERPDTVAKRTMTPGRISRVIQELEEVRELERRGAQKNEVSKRLQAVAREVKAIERDLEPEELKRIDGMLESAGLPPLERLPKPIYPEPRAMRPEEDRMGYEPRQSQGARQKLRHHRRFVVGDTTPRLSKPPL